MQQKMRVGQVMLYRQDLKDLFELTIGKMDAYMMVNVLMLGITAEMFYKGRAPLDVPAWLFWFWSISLSGSFFFILFSTWLALHASVLAHTYMARTLTQWLRLPIPSVDEINAGSARLEEYENNSFLDFVRPPVFVPMGESMGNTQYIYDQATMTKDLSSHWTEFSEHFSLFNSLHTKWQAHEAYARVSMCFGTNQLLASFSYFSLTYWSVDYENPWIGSMFVILSTVAQLIHVRMSLNLTKSEHYLCVCLIVCSSFTVTVAAALCTNIDQVTGIVSVPDSALALACIGYVFHFCWISFFLIQTHNDENGMPLKFSSVWCLEILGVPNLVTIRDIEEPRVDFPGFISAPTFAPLNTYNANSTHAHLASATLPADVVAQCTKLEAQLQHLFAYWGRKSHDLSPEDLEHIEQLKSAFDSDLELFRKGAGPTEWVRLAYETDTGVSAPYFVNSQTGEIRWETDTPELIEINRGLSLLPEQLTEFHDNVQKLDYANRRDHALKRQKKGKPPRWPWEFFRTGGILILICWVSALVETIMDWTGVEPRFSNHA